MTKREVAAKMRKGIEYQEFLDCRETQGEHIEYMASVLNVTSTIEAITSGVPALACVLGALHMGVDGLAIANLTKEQVIELVTRQYDETQKKKEEWLKKVETDQEFGDKDAVVKAVAEAAKEVADEFFADNMFPTSGKVTVH